MKFLLGATLIFWLFSSTNSYVPKIQFKKDLMLNPKNEKNKALTFLMKNLYLKQTSEAKVEGNFFVWIKIVALVERGFLFNIWIQENGITMSFIKCKMEQMQ